MPKAEDLKVGDIVSWNKTLGGDQDYEVVTIAKPVLVLKHLRDNAKYNYTFRNMNSAFRNGYATLKSTGKATLKSTVKVSFPILIQFNNTYEIITKAENIPVGQEFKVVMTRIKIR